MKVSIIIPTYNGAHKIVYALDSLQKQTYNPDEVIVVIDGSTDQTKSVVEERLPHFKKLIIIDQPNGGRAQVRNRGAVAASNELLVFMDDDIVAPEYWLSNHIRHHEKYPGSLVSGRLDQAVSPDSQNEFDIFENWLNARWNKPVRRTVEDEVLLEKPYITANNFSILKDDFVRLGMFDPRLTDAEDYDLAVRAAQAHEQMYLSNKCHALHLHGLERSFSKYIKRLREYRKAGEALVKLKPELYGDPAVNERYPTLPKGFKAFLFRMLSNKYFLESLDKGVWKIFPVGLRCNIYALIVTANGVYFPRVKI